jgi:hypothetical protein
VACPRPGLKRRKVVEDSRVTANSQDPSGVYPETTGVTETADRLYIHSLHAHPIDCPPFAHDEARAESKGAVDIKRALAKTPPMPSCLQTLHGRERHDCTTQRT